MLAFSWIMLQWASCTINIGNCSHCSIAFTLSYTRFSSQIHACTHERTHFEAHIGFGTFLISTVFDLWTFMNVCPISGSFARSSTGERWASTIVHSDSFIVKRLIDNCDFFFINLSANYVSSSKFQRVFSSISRRMERLKDLHIMMRFANDTITIVTRLIASFPFNRIVADYGFIYLHKYLDKN